MKNNHAPLTFLLILTSRWSLSQICYHMYPPEGFSSLLTQSRDTRKCAVQRAVISLAQPGRIGGNILGSSNPPGSESRRGT